MTNVIRNDKYNQKILTAQRKFWLHWSFLIAYAKPMQSEMTNAVRIYVVQSRFSDCIGHFWLNWSFLIVLVISDCIGLANDKQYPCLMKLSILLIFKRYLSIITTEIEFCCSDKSVWKSRYLKWVEKSKKQQNRKNQEFTLIYLLFI